MLSVSPGVKIFLYAQAADLRRGYDGLASIVQEAMDEDPLFGSLFLFVNKRGNRIKLFYWDRDGYAIWMKKLESDCPHFFLFTEIGRPANNLACRPAAAGGMDSVSTRNGPRRRPMPRQIAVIAPPRAQFPAGP